MPLPEDEFRRRLRMVTSEFVNLLRHPELVDDAPAEIRLHGPSIAIGELWSTFVRELRAITFTYSVPGERRPSAGAPQDLPENTTSSITSSTG